MIDLDGLTRALPVTSVEVTRWVTLGWVRPHEDGEPWRFAEIDVARVRLICDLTRDLSLTEDSVPVVLSLMDQVFDLRTRIRRVGAVIEALPEEHRRVLLERLGPGQMA